MMKNKFQFLLLILIFNCICLNAQLINVDYKISLIDKNDAVLHSELIQDLETKINNISFNLLFNKNESVFEINSNENISKDDLFSILLMSDMVGKKYYHSKNSNLSLIELEDFMIQDSTKTEWTITNETKKICGYLCYKATANLEKYNYNKYHFCYPVTAWFTKEIIQQFGPKGYGELPGLILELDQIYFSFKATSITNENFKTLTKPQKKIITSTEYYELIGI